jgi:hypothetical protein
MKGRENTHLTYLGNWADPCALMDGYLHKEKPNASESLCFPLQKKFHKSVGTSKRFLFKFNIMLSSFPSSKSYIPLKI